MKVAFAGAFAAQMAEPVRKRLSLPCEVVVDDEAGIVPRLTDVDVLVSMGFSAHMAGAAPRLGLVQVPGAGLDRIDRGALGPGTHLANAYGHEAGIAEYIIGAMIALTRSFGRLDAKMRRGEWESRWAVCRAAPPLWPELAGKTLGILGFGHIGQALARRAIAFDMQVCAIRRQAQAETAGGVSFVGGPERLDDALRLAEYPAVHLSLSDATRNLLDERRLRLMKPTAFLVNVARAEIFDEGALYAALASGKLAGAVLDVWYRYPTSTGPTPPATQPFHELGNVIMTPHISGWTEGMLEARAKLIAVSARTAFSLLLPPLIDEFGWQRGVVAGAFSFGFLFSAALSPIVGRVMDRHGPRVVIESGVCLLAAGLFLAPAIKEPWQLYATLGVLVGGGANLMTFTAQSLYLPNWFVRRRGLAISIAFTGVGIGAIVLLPWLQTIIGQEGWRASCWTMGLLVLLVLGPLNLLVRHKPQDIGLLPDGAPSAPGTAKPRSALTVVDPAWTSVDWRIAGAIRTRRFWWIVLGY